MIPDTTTADIVGAPVVAPLNPMVHRLRRQCGTSKGTVSLGTQLRGVRSKTCQRAAGWCGFNSPVFSAATAGRRGAAPVTENAGSRGGRRHMILGGILQSMGALKGNRVACHSPFPQRLDQISLIGIIAEQANVTRLLRHRRLERRIRSTCTAPPMSGSQPNISTCACRFFFIAACEIMARLSASVVSSGHPAV